MGESTSYNGDSEVLLHEVDYLPLAISQAAAFMNENDITPSEYLEELQASDRDRKDLLSEELRDSRRDAETAQSVIRT
jgi:hypothetical protein